MSENNQATALVVSPQDMGMTPVVSVATALRRIKELQEFVQAVMVKGEDFGIIPGTQKPTLFKSGAEKLCEMYGLAPTCEITNRIEQWEVPFFQYELRVRLVSKATGLIVAEGIGSCNSREKRYRNQDTYTIVNTLQKMAKKRALVDAALSATRSSGLFTQDLEDLQDDHEHAQTVRREFTVETAPQGNGQQQAASRPAPNPSATGGDLATPAQVRAIYSIGRSLDKTDGALEQWSVQVFGSGIADLTRRQASEAITALKEQQPAVTR